MTTETADTDGRAVHYAYTPYSTAPAVAQAHPREETLASFSANNARYREDWVNRPYHLEGPVVSKLRPDVWAVYQAAAAGKYEVVADPGLVLRLGAFGIFNTWYVMFGSKYNQRFLLATAPLMVCKDLAEFCAWLREHPARS